jgi:hypothetical protein
LGHLLILKKWAYNKRFLNRLFRSSLNFRRGGFGKGAGSDFFMRLRFLMHGGCTKRKKKAESEKDEKANALRF